MSLTVFTGPMFCGKTSHLIEAVGREGDLGASCILINHESDNRHSQGELSTHASRFHHMRLSVEMIKTASLKDVKIDGYDVIGIDEAQFFEDLKSIVLEWKSKGKTIYVSGLDGDFRGEKIGSVIDLCSHAESFTEFCAECIPCLTEAHKRREENPQIPLEEIKRGIRPAAYSVRLSKEKEVVLVGGADKYIPVCWFHRASYIH